VHDAAVKEHVRDHPYRMPMPQHHARKQLGVGRNKEADENADSDDGQIAYRPSPYVNFRAVGQKDHCVTLTRHVPKFSQAHSTKSHDGPGINRISRQPHLHHRPFFHAPPPCVLPLPSPRQQFNQASDSFILALLNLPYPFLHSLRTRP